MTVICLLKRKMNERIEFWTMHADECLANGDNKVARKSVEEIGITFKSREIKELISSLDAFSVYNTFVMY